MIDRSILVWFIFSAVAIFGSVSDSVNLGLFDDQKYYDLRELSPSKKNESYNGTKLNMAVFYEALCPDCLDFFGKQFAKTWSPFYDYLNVTLVPYGKTSQTQDNKGNWDFNCQHGEKECYCNRIQACAISRLHKQRRKKLFSFISCYMSHKDKETYGPKCARPNNIAFGRLKKCAKSKEGFDLLARFGDITHDRKPKIKWIPTIIFNEKYNQTENDLASSDLKSLLCQKLDNKPKACK